MYVGVFGKKLRADRRYLSANVNLFELGGVREEEERALMLAVEEGRMKHQISVKEALKTVFMTIKWKHTGSN